MSKQFWSPCDDPSHNRDQHKRIAVHNGYWIDFPPSLLLTSHLNPYCCYLYCLIPVLRKGQLSHPLPDFSKVEPRVRFPKSNYKPPKSRKPPHNERSKPEAPVVFKSPADIVREALSSNFAGPSNPAAPTDSQKPSNTTMPEEFRCPLQAGAIMQQLQV